MKKMSINDIYNSVCTFVSSSGYLFPGLGDSNNDAMVEPVAPAVEMPIYPPMPEDPRLVKLKERLVKTEEDILIIETRIEELRPHCDSTNIGIYQYLWKRRLILENHHGLIKRAYLELVYKLEMRMFSTPTKSLSMSVS